MQFSEIIDFFSLFHPSQNMASLLWKIASGINAAAIQNTQ
jgi:hypothetical protein